MRRLICFVRGHSWRLWWDGFSARCDKWHQCDRCGLFQVTNGIQPQSCGQPRGVEEEALQWLALAYRNTNTDKAKYTRWCMAVAYAAGKAKGLAEPNPARPQ